MSKFRMKSNEYTTYHQNEHICATRFLKLLILIERVIDAWDSKVAHKNYNV